MFRKIPKYSKKLRGMFEKISGMFEKITGIDKKGNVQADSEESKFRFILQNLARFYQSLQLNFYEAMKKEKNNY